MNFNMGMNHNLQGKCRHRNTFYDILNVPTFHSNTEQVYINSLLSNILWTCHTIYYVLAGKVCIAVTDIVMSLFILEFL